jgi:phosphoglycolate phosphatase-like HAD superfamily hydrolase
MIVLFWDIDGTLLTTGKAGVPAWDEAVREVTGRDFELASLRIAGLTDYQIAAHTFELLGLEPDEAAVRRIVRRYEELLPASLPLKKGTVLPNVREILEQLESRVDVRSYLLTGNTRGGARAKLTHYRLMHFFPDGAFAEDAGARATIAARALELAKRDGEVADEAVFVIGDTPHDVHCANAIGARTVAVATGGYTMEELAAHQPWRVFAELPPVDEFVELIERGRSEPDGRGPDPSTGSGSPRAGSRGDKARATTVGASGTGDRE